MNAGLAARDPTDPLFAKSRPCRSTVAPHRERREGLFGGYACVMAPSRGGHETGIRRSDRAEAGVRNRAVVTSIAVGSTARGHRSLDEKMMVRFPGMYRAWAGLVLRFLRPDMRLRRWFVRRAVVSGWAAAQRRDFELMLLRYAPDVLYDADAGFQALGVPGAARGRAEMANVLVELLDVWDRQELAPVLVVDLARSLIVLGRTRVHGPASGIELDLEIAQLLTLERGLVTRERDFNHWDDALRAASLDPAALDLPSRR